MVEAVQVGQIYLEKASFNSAGFKFSIPWWDTVLLNTQQKKSSKFFS